MCFTRVYFFPVSFEFDCLDDVLKLIYFYVFFLNIEYTIKTRCVGSYFAKVFFSIYVCTIFYVSYVLMPHWIRMNY